MKQDTPPDTARPYASDEARWEAVLRRDPAADDCFVYAVRTTGVFARPSSSARRPRRENVEFFDTPQAALAAGYRPSDRTSADRTAAAAQRAAAVASACRLIEASETPPSLELMAGSAGMSPYHFHRLFKAEVGLTPKAYADAFRSRRVRERLGTASSITHAIYDAGFNSNSRFYEASTRLLGMRPRDFRRGGQDAEIRFAVAECSLGALVVAQSRVGICAILLGDDPDALLRSLQDQFPRAEFIGGDADFERLVAEVVGFIEAPALGLNLPLDIRGTAFQERVWQALREIPPGTTVSYSDLAARIGAPGSARAVARACASNRIAVAIPCHRVVRQSGDLAGYRWGIERKRALLLREAKG